MKKFDFKKSIYKYAILLSITSLINYIWVYFMHRYLDIYAMQNIHSVAWQQIISLAPKIINLMFNITFAVLVFKDFKKNDIKSPLIVTITALFGFIGIALFYIQLIYDLKITKPAPC
ncbi:hypothetical protein [Marinifilum fragile]|uniref:hypothetical protein n=1 Tax=Marinifilum fragile TaxID=570161 RepID=UPI002AA95180|nr:hypothetical protein [Marinifilum fragile]